MVENIRKRFWSFNGKINELNKFEVVEYLQEVEERLEKIEKKLKIKVG
jgi:TolA-binding protein